MVYDIQYSTFPENATLSSLHIDAWQQYISDSFDTLEGRISISSDIGLLQ